MAYRPTIAYRRFRVLDVLDVFFPLAPFLVAGGVPYHLLLLHWNTQCQLLKNGRHRLEEIAKFDSRLRWGKLRRAEGGMPHVT